MVHYLGCGYRYEGVKYLWYTTSDVDTDMKAYMRYIEFFLFSG